MWWHKWVRLRTVLTVILLFSTISTKPRNLGFVLLCFSYMCNMKTVCTVLMATQFNDCGWLAILPWHLFLLSIVFFALSVHSGGRYNGSLWVAAMARISLTWPWRPPTPQLLWVAALQPRRPPRLQQWRPTTWTRRVPTESHFVRQVAKGNFAAASCCWSSAAHSKGRHTSRSMLPKSPIWRNTSRRRWSLNNVNVVWLTIGILRLDLLDYNNVDETNLSAEISCINQHRGEILDDGGVNDFCSVLSTPDYVDTHKWLVLALWAASRAGGRWWQAHRMCVSLAHNKHNKHIFEVDNLGKNFHNYYYNVYLLYISY